MKQICEAGIAEPKATGTKLQELILSSSAGLWPRYMDVPSKYLCRFA